jgi:hypothetical protein
MATKKEWQQYLKLCKSYLKAYTKYVAGLEKWVSKQNPGEVSTADAGPGSNPPTPPPPPPPFP